VDNLYLAVEQEDGRRLTIAPISTAKLERCADRPADISGYFLTEEDSRLYMGEIKILAHIQDSESALRPAAIFKMT
jgi:hypothetical protein